jgi:sugar phosphate isomerase/epimerase
MDRRTFLGTMTAATVLSNRLTWAFAEHKIDKLGVQLYTVRDAMQQDFDGTLAKVAAIGYKETEFAGFNQASDGTVTFWNRSPKEVRASLDKHGLTAPSTHVTYASLEPDKFAKVLEASHVIGHKYIVMPWIEENMRNQPGIWQQVAEKLNQAGEASKKAGIQFAYHNHWFEFLPIDGKEPYDILLEKCDANLVKMEMDLCWMAVAKRDPLVYFNRYPGRFPLVHVKDLKSLPTVTASGAQNFGDSVDMTSVGNGIVDWKRIFAQANKAGIKLYIVEHDRPQSPFDSIKDSYTYLEKLRF